MKNFKLTMLMLGLLASTQSFAKAQSTETVTCFNDNETILIELSAADPEAETLFVMLEGENELVMDLIGTESNPSLMTTKDAVLEVTASTVSDTRTFVLAFLNEETGSEHSVYATLKIYRSIWDQTPSETHQMLCEQ